MKKYWTYPMFGLLLRLNTHQIPRFIDQKWISTIHHNVLHPNLPNLTDNHFDNLMLLIPNLNLCLPSFTWSGYCTNCKIPHQQSIHQVITTKDPLEFISKLKSKEPIDLPTPQLICPHNGTTDLQQI